MKGYERPVLSGRCQSPGSIQMSSIPFCLAPTFANHGEQPLIELKIEVEHWAG